MRGLANLLSAALAVTTAVAASNIDPAESLVRSEFIGEIDWRPSAESGAAINQYYCSGFIHGANVGWITLGAGAPLDGVRYRNDSAADYGVNVLPGGALRGFAYGANIGWISFDERGNPRIDWTTGKITGSVYSANVGWIPLESAGGLRVERIAESPDRDNDGLPDAWEISFAGSLTRLSAASDSDEDGSSDRDEFLAGTNPLDNSEKLGPITLHVESASNLKSVQWPTKLGHVYRLERRASLQPGSAWTAVNSVPVIGTGNPVSLDLSPSIAGPSFFRVRAFPPLTSLVN